MDLLRMRTAFAVELGKVHGRDLDCVAANLGLKRKKFLLVFKESDKALRNRIRKAWR
jgi:hypothetical protein